MTLNEYQNLAARTINTKGSTLDIIGHALHGLAAEVGEVHSLYQKEYQGHPLDLNELKKEAGDCMWFVAELCTAYGWALEEVAQANIAKLLHRYPNGFEADRSIHREE